MKLLKVVMLVGAVALFMSPTLKAGPVVFDFSNCAQATSPCVPGANGTSISFSAGVGESLTATSFIDVPPPPTGFGLFMKNAGPGETGIGTTLDTSDHEITGADYVSFNVSGLSSNQGTFALGSLQTGEGYEICVVSSETGMFNNGNALGSNCFGGSATSGVTANAFVNWGANSFVELEGTGSDGSGTLTGDVVAASLTQTPEPATLTLLGLGMFGLAGARRKAAKK
jgi:hypothetical protein